jgi:DNA-binding CsgD family transcriptional regulator
LNESELSSSALRAALTLVQEVQEAPNLDAYRRRVLGLRHLIPCDAIGYNEVDLESGKTFALLEPSEAAFAGGLEAFARLAHQHPVIRYHAETGDPSPRAISDFLSQEELHSLELYQLVYKPMGAEDQLSFILPGPPGIIVGVAMNRSTRGFSPLERELIDLVRPHLSQAILDAHMRDSFDPAATKRLRELGLTERQSEVMRLLAEGLSAAELAERLSISTHTARHHITNIYARLGVSSRGAAVAEMLRSVPPQI